MISIEVTKMPKLPTAKDVTAALVRGMKAATIAAATQAKENATGRPGPNVQTSRLRSSIATAVYDVAGDTVVGVIGSNVKYAKRIELGFGGAEKVKAHMRSTVFGRKVRPFVVQSFARTANTPAYPFLRPAVESPFMRRVIQTLLEREIKKVLNGA